MKIQKIVNAYNNKSFKSRSDSVRKNECVVSKDTAGLLTAALMFLAASSQANIIDIKKQVYEDYLRRKDADKYLLENFDFDGDKEISINERLSFEEYKRLMSKNKRKEAQNVILSHKKFEDEFSQYDKIVKILTIMPSYNIADWEISSYKKQYLSALHKISTEELKAHISDNASLYANSFPSSLLLPVANKIAIGRYKNFPKDYNPSEETKNLALKFFNKKDNKLSLNMRIDVLYGKYPDFINGSDEMAKENLADYLTKELVENRINLKNSRDVKYLLFLLSPNHNKEKRVNIIGYIQ